MADKISIGLLGLGVVGSGVIKMIKENKMEIQDKLGCTMQVKHVLVRNKDRDRDVWIDQNLLTTNASDVLNDPEIDIIIEVMGGVEDAHQYIRQALVNKKQVVTANKDLIALHGEELLKLAKQNECDLFYEASVGGGIPIIRGLTDGLAADQIQEIMGIINGTTNYILTKMDEDHVSFNDALADAQKLGFAEADPTADIEGLDAARKMAILARLAFSTHIELADIETKGITNISLKDLEYGKQLGFTMKLIGLARANNGSVEVSVQPTFIHSNHPLAGVKNEYNAVYVKGEAVGETMFYGPGAGSLPTATAVMSDVMEATKNVLLGVTGKSIVTTRFEKQLMPAEERYGQYYIRLHVKDEVGSFAHISQLFQDMDISFKRIVQTPVKKHEIAEIILVTHRTTLANFNKTMLQLNEMDVVKSIESYFRVEGDEV